MKACRRHEFVQSQYGHVDHSGFRPSVLEELLVHLVPCRWWRQTSHSTCLMLIEKQDYS